MQHQHPRRHNGRLDTAASPDRCAGSVWKPYAKLGRCFLEPDRGRPRTDRRHTLSCDRRSEEWWPGARAPSVERGRSPRAGSPRSLAPPSPTVTPLRSWWRWGGDMTVALISSVSALCHRWGLAGARGCRAGHGDHATCHGSWRRSGGRSGVVGVTQRLALVSAGAVPRARAPSRRRTADTASSPG